LELVVVFDQPWSRLARRFHVRHATVRDHAVQAIGQLVKEGSPGSGGGEGINHDASG
jgi:hypothetical protein